MGWIKLCSTYWHQTAVEAECCCDRIAEQNIWFTCWQQNHQTDYWYVDQRGVLCILVHKLTLFAYFTQASLALSGQIVHDCYIHINLTLISQTMLTLVIKINNKSRYMLIIIIWICAFCMMSISSGLRSRSIEEMLSMLFLRTMPVVNGLAMMPGDAWEWTRHRVWSKLIEKDQATFEKVTQHQHS